MTKAQPDLEAPWWDQFPELLEAEALRFREQFQPAFGLYHDPRSPQPRPESYCPGNFVWRGEVQVRVGKAGQGRTLHRFQVDFVYPLLYPFKRIQVFPVQPTVKRSRHLESGGNLCYMPHMPNAWTPSTTNVEVLRRVQNWFRGYLTDWRLADHVDLPEYRAYVDEIAPMDVFLPAHVYRRIWGGYGLLELQARNWGTRRDVLAERLIDERSGTEHKRDGKPELDRVLLGAGDREWLRAVWFDLAREPFITSAADLFRTIAAAGPFADDLEAATWLDGKRHQHALDGQLLVFLRFRAASSGEMQWAAYTLRPGSEEPFLKLPGLNPQLKRVSAYHRGRIRAVPLFPVRLRDLFRRLDGVYDAMALHEKHVTVIGCGALGSPAAALLGKAGIGHFTLVDGDRLAPGNVMRHELDLKLVGLNKAVALAIHLQNFNPYAEVKSIPAHVDSVQGIRKAIEHADAVIVAIADEAIEHLISRVALRMGKTVLYARGLASMAVGRIHRVIPGQDACPVCLCQHRRDPNGDSHGRWLEVPEPRPLLLYDDNCGSPAIPGAAVDTEQIAGLLARKTIDVLLGTADEFNQWVWVGRRIPDAPDPRLHVPEVTYPLQFDPLDRCDECRPYQEARQAAIQPNVRPADHANESPAFDVVELPGEVLKAILSESASCGKLEGGGVLAGYVDAGRKTAVITHATDGGPAAVHRTHYFMRDAVYCQRQLDRIDEETEGRCLYVGEWHKHAAWDTTPSPTDRGSLVNTATQRNYAVSQSLMLICGMPDYRCPAHHIIKAYSYRRGESEVRELPIQITAGR